MSAVPATKNALYALLQAHTWPGTQPTVRWGGPTESEDFGQNTGGVVELIYFRDTRDITDDYTVLGAARIDEEFELESRTPRRSSGPS